MKFFSSPKLQNFHKFSKMKFLSLSKLQIFPHQSNFNASLSFESDGIFNTIPERESR